MGEFMSIDFTWLENNVFRNKLTDSEKDQLCDVMERKVFASGDTIMTQGERGGALYLLRSGSAAILREIKGQQQCLTTVYEGALLGELTFLTGQQVTATVVASEDTVTYKMNRLEYAKLMQTNQELVYALFTYMLAQTCTIIRQMNEEHIELMGYMTGIYK